MVSSQKTSIYLYLNLKGKYPIWTLKNSLFGSFFLFKGKKGDTNLSHDPPGLTNKRILIKIYTKYDTQKF
jgi:hypothetical protein